MNSLPHVSLPSSRQLSNRWIYVVQNSKLGLFSSSRVKIFFNAVAFLFIGLSLFLLILFFYNWIDVSTKSDELLSAMRNAALVNARTTVKAPAAPLTEKERQEIVERNLFNTRSQKVVAKSETPEEAPAKVNTDFELLGTFYSGPNSEAIIENKQTRLQDAFRIGEKVFDEATLVSVLRDRVELRRGSETEFLYLALTPSDGAGTSAADVDETISIDGAELEEALDNLPMLLTQARAVPFFQDGQPVGLRLFAIRDGSLYQKAGLRNGDILKSVNGNSLADISKAAKLFEMLRDERSIVLDMERSREARKVQYSIR